MGWGGGSFPLHLPPAPLVSAFPDFQYSFGLCDDQGEREGGRGNPGESMYMYADDYTYVCFTYTQPAQEYYS